MQGRPGQEVHHLKAPGPGWYAEKYGGKEVRQMLEEQEIKDRQRILGDNIRRRREELKMSATTLAQQAGLTAANLSKIENGEGNPKYVTLCSIAEALKTDVAYLSTDHEQERLRSLFYQLEGMPPAQRNTVVASLAMMIQGAKSA